MKSSPAPGTVVVARAVSALVPASSARSVSAIFTASALRSGTTKMFPAPAPGVSRPAASVLMRAMSAGLSPRTSKLLVRGSTATAAFGGEPGAEGSGEVSGITRCRICAMSIAEAFCRRTICTSPAAGRSIDWMMRWMRRTFSA